MTKLEELTQECEDLNLVISVINTHERTRRSYIEDARGTDLSLREYGLKNILRAKERIRALVRQAEAERDAETYKQLEHNTELAEQHR
jgi:hypothetical protein